MSVAVRKAGHVSVIDVNGSFRLGYEDQPVKRMVDELVQAGAQKILVNLRKISTIDSAGIGELIDCKHTIEKEGGEICLVRPEKDIAFRPMLLTRMELEFRIFDDELAAVGSF